MNDFSALTAAILEFRDARDWRQFHSLRSLIVSLNLEAAELLELTQWKSDAEIEALPAEPASREALRDECADVLLYLLLIADSAGIDLAAAARGEVPRGQGVRLAGEVFGTGVRFCPVIGQGQPVILWWPEQRQLLPLPPSRYRGVRVAPFAG